MFSYTHILCLYMYIVLKPFVNSLSYFFITDYRKFNVYIYYTSCANALMSNGKRILYYKRIKK